MLLSWESRMGNRLMEIPPKRSSSDLSKRKSPPSPSQRSTGTVQDAEWVEHHHEEQDEEPFLDFTSTSV